MAAEVAAEVAVVVVFEPIMNLRFQILPVIIFFLVFVGVVMWQRLG